MGKPHLPDDKKMDVSQSLKKYRSSDRPVEIWFEDDLVQSHTAGFVVDIGTDFVMIARLFQSTMLNGLRAIRLTAIREILATHDEAFILRAMQVQAQMIPPMVPFRAETLAEFLATVCDHFSMVIVESELQCAAGMIEQVEDDVVRMRTISAEGDWIEEPFFIAASEINNVYFGSQYEETLGLIGELANA